MVAGASADTSEDIPAATCTGWFLGTDIFKCLITQYLKAFESCYYMENPFW